VETGRNELTAYDYSTVGAIAPVLWAAGGSLAILIDAFYPPTYAIGAAGWVLTVVGLGIGLLVPLWQRRHRGVHINRDVLLMQATFSLLLIATAQWLSGPSAPFREMLPLTLVAAAFTQTRLRTALFAAGVAAAAFAPLIYAPSSIPVLHVVVEVVVWITLAIVIVLLTEHLHARRVDLSLAEQAARHQARIDELTGLLNRRAFQEALAHVAPEDDRRERRVTLVLIDLDSFKLINDRYGHLAGDACLRAVGDALRRSVRDRDRAYRWGGDEFAVVLTDSSDEDATMVVERIRACVEEAKPLPDGTSPTLGCGWATHQAGQTAADLLELADQRLLRTKARDARERGVRALTLVRDLEPSPSEAL